MQDYFLSSTQTFKIRFRENMILPWNSTFPRSSEVKGQSNLFKYSISFCA